MRHRLTTAWNYQKFQTFPDTLNIREPRFPGFVGAGQASSRMSWSNSLRSTLGGNFVNELRVAYAGAPVKFFDELGPDDWANQGGFQLDFPLITEPTASPNRQGRTAWNLLIEDSVNWLKGSHSVTMGGSFTNFQVWLDSMNQIPEIDFGVLAADPMSHSRQGLNDFTGRYDDNPGLILANDPDRNANSLVRCRCC